MNAASNIQRHERRPAKRLKLFDLLSRIVPSTFFLLIVLRNITDLEAFWKTHDFQSHGWSVVVFFLARLTTTCFLALMSLLFLIRIEPLQKAKGVWPRVMAIVGTFCLYVVTLFPRANLSVSQTLTATVISLVGSCLSIFALIHLGRSFSLMAEARRLVTSGPYRLVRHPLYLFETIASLGILLQFLSWPTVLIFLIYLVIQLQRMKNEEKVLEQTFPEYGDYRLRTSRLIPGIY